MRIKIWQIDIDIFSNQTLLESKLFILAYTNEDIASKNLKLKGIIYQKELLVIIMSSSMEKTFFINQVIQILNDMKKLEY